MHSAENTGDVRRLTDAELDNVGGGHPAALVVPALFALGVIYGCLSGPYDFEATPPSWYNTMI
jgi:hypothetical protein